MAADAARRARLGLHEGHQIDHPVLAEFRTRPQRCIDSSPDSDARQDWIVDEHRVGADDESSGYGGAPAPATSNSCSPRLRHLELPLRLTAVSLHEPLVVPDGADVTVRITVSRTRRNAPAEHF
jgi:hypothetical protein